MFIYIQDMYMNISLYHCMEKNLQEPFVISSNINYLCIQNIHIVSNNFNFSTQPELEVYQFISACLHLEKLKFC